MAAMHTRSRRAATSDTGLRTRSGSPGSHAPQQRITPDGDLSAADVRSLQRTAGNATITRALTAGDLARPSARIAPTRTLARLQTSAQWLAYSDISLGPFRNDRSTELQRVDKAVLDYEALAGAAPRARMDQLIEIEVAINSWRTSKGGTAKALKRARGPRIDALYNAVLNEKPRVERELKREKIEGIDRALLAGLPEDPSAAGQELFDRFMTRFRGGAAKYTLSTAGQKSPWDGGAGPYACGTFAKALADLAQAAGLEASSVQVTPRNFVTPEVDADFVDQTAKGNIQVKGKRRRRYFFTQHWVTEIGGDFYCPTSGKELGGRAATELVDSAIGELTSRGAGAYGRGATTVTKVGETAEGGGLYDLVRG